MRRIAASARRERRPHFWRTAAREAGELLQMVRRGSHIQARTSRGPACSVDAVRGRSPNPIRVQVPVTWRLPGRPLASATERSTEGCNSSRIDGAIWQLMRYWREPNTKKECQTSTGGNNPILSQIVLSHIVIYITTIRNLST